jgi:hypothetical protein
MKIQSIQFNAVIKQHGTMNAAFVEFPFSTEERTGENKSRFRQ